MSDQRKEQLSRINVALQNLRGRQILNVVLEDECLSILCEDKLHHTMDLVISQFGDASVDLSVRRTRMADGEIEDEFIAEEIWPWRETTLAETLDEMSSCLEDTHHMLGELAKAVKRSHRPN